MNQNYPPSAGLFRIGFAINIGGGMLMAAFLSIKGNRKATAKATLQPIRIKPDGTEQA